MTDDLPPPVQLVLEEGLADPSNRREFDRTFRRLLPELQRQSRWTLDNFEYADDTPTAGAVSPLTITASGALNPLTPSALCVRPKCREDAARAFARTLGLYADAVTLPDVITALAVDAKKATERHLTWAASFIAAIRC